MTGRRILVTGASGGIGRAVAETFAEADDRVAVHYSARPERAEQTLAALAGDGHLMLRADLTDPAAVERLVVDTVSALGGVDVLVNNAAALIGPHPVATTDYADWQHAWQVSVGVNLVGAANTSYCAARQMIAQGTGGRIINVGTRGAYRGEPDYPSYGASKAGMHALGQSLAVSLAPYGIAVTTVAPGFVSTDRVADRLAGESGAAIRAQSPFGRVATPAEIAAAVLWLASPEAGWASGTVVDLNGASYLR